MGILVPLLAFIAPGFVGAVTVSGTFLNETGQVLEARVQHADREAELEDTRLELISAAYTSPAVEAVFRNTGRVPLRDFPSWDVWTSFHEAAGTFHPERLTYTSAAPAAAGEWRVAGIYLDAASFNAEAHQPGIFDPSEEIKLEVTLSATDDDPEANHVTLGLPVGATATIAFTWEALADTPSDVNSGGSLTNDGTYVYGMRGDNANDFWRYDASTNAWTALTDVPFTPTAGGAIVYAKDTGLGYVYAFRGEDRDDFWRYSIADDDWTRMADPPLDTDDGAALTWDGVNTLYAFRGDHID